jgi:hypothetical protein
MVKAWIAAHTGLPSFYTDAPVRVMCGDRVIARGSAQALVSDPLAEPGVPTTYQVGDESVTLTRPLGTPGTAILTDDTGRGVSGLIYVDTGDQENYSPEVTQFNPFVTRWSTTDPAYTGSGTFTLKDPSKRGQVEALLRRHRVLIVGPAAPSPGMGLRRVIVTQVQRTRYAGGARVRFEVSWSEARLSDREACGVPVVTWGEYAAASDGVFTGESYLQICQRIAGMPA